MTNLVSFELPPLYCPFPVRVNQGTTPTANDTAEWLRHTGICADAQSAVKLGTIAASMCAYMYPTPATEAVARGLCHCVAWAFALDDLHGPSTEREGADYLDTCLYVLRVAHSPTWAATHPDLYVRAFGDIVADLAKGAAPSLVQRFADAQALFLFSGAAQISGRRRCFQPGIDDYFAIRYPSARATLSGVDIALGVDIPLQQFDAPGARAAIDAGFMIAALDNDLASYQREVARGEAHDNIVEILRREHPDTSFSQTVADVVGLRDRMMNLFVHLRDQMADDARSELVAYLDAIGASVAGSAAWGVMTERYASPEASKLSIDWADKPSDSSLDPLPFPSIAWWWDDLRR